MMRSELCMFAFEHHLNGYREGSIFKRFFIVKIIPSKTAQSGNNQVKLNDYLSRYDLCFLASWRKDKDSLCHPDTKCSIWRMWFYITSLPTQVNWAAWYGGQRLRWSHFSAGSCQPLHPGFLLLVTGCYPSDPPNWLHQPMVSVFDLWATKPL